MMMSGGKQVTVSKLKQKQDKLQQLTSDMSVRVFAEVEAVLQFYYPKEEFVGKYTSEFTGDHQDIEKRMGNIEVCLHVAKLNLTQSAATQDATLPPLRFAAIPKAHFNKVRSMVSQLKYQKVKDVLNQTLNEYELYAYPTTDLLPGGFGGQHSFSKATAAGSSYPQNQHNLQQDVALKAEQWQAKQAGVPNAHQQKMLLESANAASHHNDEITKNLKTELPDDDSRYNVGSSLVNKYNAASYYNNQRQGFFN